MAQNAD